MSSDRQLETHARPISVWGISAHYWPVVSGAAVQAQRLYGALATEGFEFTVLTARHAQAAGRPRSELRDGVRILRLSILPSWLSGVALIGKFWRLACQLSFALACARRVATARASIDVLHVHGQFLPPLIVLARILRIPLLFKETMLEPHSRRLGARMQRWGLARADKLVTLSQTMTDQCPWLDSARVEVIPQGIDTSHFRPVSAQEKSGLRKNLKLDPQAFLIVFVGAVLHRKGADILVRAFVEAGRNHPRLGLVVIGQNDFTVHHLQHLAEERQLFCDGLRRTLKESGVAESAVWAGKLPPADVVAYLQASDMFCFPSRREGVPSAPLEAMACGLPVVVSSLDGTSAELLTDGREGFIVETQDPGDYAGRIVELARDEELARRMGRAGRRRIEAAFSFRSATDRYRRLFLSLARTERGAR